jgi:hypothetical protein
LPSAASSSGDIGGKSSQAGWMGSVSRQDDAMCRRPLLRPRPPVGHTHGLCEETA